MMTREEKIEIAVTLGSITALVFGWRRLAGGIAVSNGLYNIAVHKPARKTVGGINLALGTAFLLFPDWPESARAALSNGVGSGGTPNPNKPLPPQSQPPNLPAPIELNMPPTRYIALPSLDRDVGGNWTLLDVRDLQNAGVKSKAPSLKPGDVVSLILQQPAGPYLVYSVRVTGGSAQTMYSGQWMSKPPTGGPSTPEFGKEHVYAVS
jgi:hypothetical protein